MNTQTYKNVSGAFHRRWIARSFGMHTHYGAGIDVWDDTTGIEVKSCKGRSGYEKWAVDARQPSLFAEQNPGKELFWAFTRYDLTCDIAAVAEDALAHFVKDRKAWLLPWDWIYSVRETFPATGPYRHVYRSAIYASGICFAEIPLGKTTLFIPRDASLLDRIASL